MKRKSIIFQTILMVTFIIFNANGQSTSNWIKIKSNIDNSLTTPITKNASYLSIKIVNERIYHQSNWWTNLISKNKKAFVTVDIKAGYSDSKTLEDKRSSDMIAIQKREKPIDLGWSQYIVREIPATFSSIKLNISLSYNSDDAGDKVISIASDLSKTIPPLSVAQTYVGMISGTKLILDEVFNKKLADSYLKSNNELISATQNNLAPGFYVIFGEYTSQAYQNYVSNSDKLFWDGSQLKYDNKPIDDINYFVILIEAKQSIFPTKDINILSNTESTWAKFYVQANQTIESMQKDDVNNTKAKIRELLSSAKMVLDNDPSYIYQEKEDMHKTIREYLLTKFDVKVKQIGTDPFILFDIK